MRQIYFRYASLFVGCLAATIGMAQTNVTKTLTFNKIRFNVNTIGPAFNSPSNGLPAFHDTEWDADYIFASNMWIGGELLNGQLKLAGSTFGMSRDWTTGPFSTDANAPNKYNKVYTMTSDMITDFKTNFGQQGYVIPQEILDWPGNGVVLNGEPEHLAPFFDKNTNGKYEPQLGDYPVIKGHMAAFIMRNDMILHGETGGEPLTADFYIMYYAFKPSAPALERTVFVDYTIVNRGSQTIYDTYLGVWTDFDLGNPSDDYVGTLVDKDGVMCYNGDSNDDVSGGPSKGFGLNPPSIAQIFLSHPIEYSMYYNIGGGSTGDPSNAMDYYNYLTGIWKDNSRLVYGGNGHYDVGQEQAFPAGALEGKPCHFMFPGTSDPTGKGTDGNNYGESASWDESSAKNAPGDRRIVSSIKLGTFYPGAVITVSTAYVASKSSLQSDIEIIKIKATGIEDRAELKVGFICSPNPAGNFVKITGIQDLEATAEIMDLTGRVHITSSVANQISTESLGNGTYLVRLRAKDGSVSGSQKLIICR